MDRLIFFKGEKHPAEQISWYKAKAYCAKMNKKGVIKKFDSPWFRDALDLMSVDDNPVSRENVKKVNA